MEWRDQGVLLTMRKHGEHAAIIEVLTAEHGRHAGVVQGGGSRKMAPLLQPGGQISVEWRARLEEHLGSFKVEPIRSRAASIMAERANLLMLGAITSMLSALLPEREEHPNIYAKTLDLLDKMDAPEERSGAYVLWEMALLEELGFGTDLTSCAATGSYQDLIYVSPRSGRAVSRDAGEPYKDRLLPLPGFLRLADPALAQTATALEGLRMTGYFLENQLAPALGRDDLPAARGRFLSYLEREARDEKV